MFAQNFAGDIHEMAARNLFVQAVNAASLPHS